MFYTLLAIYVGIGLLSSVLLVAVCVRKGQTDHLARPTKLENDIRIIQSPNHRNASYDSASQQKRQSVAGRHRPNVTKTDQQTAQHRPYHTDDAVDADAQSTGLPHQETPA